METRILHLVILYDNFHCQFQRKFFVPNRKGWRIETYVQGGLAQVVERSIRIREAPRSRHGYSNWLLFTIIYIANFNASLLCQTEKVGEQKKCPRGISSSGRALDSHSRGTGIDTRILQLVFLYNYFRCQLQHKFFVPNRKGWRIEQICKGDQLKFPNQFFFTIIFIANFNASFLCQTEKVGEQKICPRGISSSGRALDSHSRGTGIDTRILKLVFLYNYFRCQLQHRFFVTNRKGWRIEKMCKARLAQVVERSIRIRQAPGWRPGYSTWLFFTIIFIANFNASFLCQTEKVGEQKICPRGISSSGRALDSHSRGTAIETRILQLVIVYNYLHCQFQRKFVVPNRKGWRIEKMSKGDQLKWQSARFAFERHRDRYPDSPISFSLQLFSLPVATQVFCAKQKRLENRKYVQGDQLQWQSARFVFERHRDRYPDSQISFSLQLFSLPIATQVFCDKQKRLENRKNVQGEISSSGRALDSHSIGTGMETRILQLVILYNNFHCQFQRKFFVPNRKGWRIETYVQGGLAQVVERWIRMREAPRSRHRYSNWLFFTMIFIANFNASLLCQTEKVEEQKQYLQGGLAQVVERWIRIREAPGSIPGFPNQFFFTIIFVANCNTSFLCQTEKVGEQNKYARGISSSGRALDSHSIGTGMETRVLQLVILYNNFHCQFQRKFFVPNRKGWRIENMSKGDQLQWQSARFAFKRHRDRYPDSQISFSLQLFSLPIATQLFCAKQKRLENRTNMQGGLAQVVERSIRIRQAPGWRPGYSNWLFFTITFIANFNASFLCQTEKVGEQKICPRGISSSGRQLDSHSRGTGIETRILQLVIVYNYLHCQFQRKFVVPNRKGWRIEKMSKGDQLKWQSARFAFERHRDRYPDSQISFSLQLFSLPIATQVFCAKQKRLENSKHVQGDQLQWQSARFAFERHRGRYPDSPISFSLQLFSLPIATQVFCAKQKRLENRTNMQGGLAQVVERSIRIRQAPGWRPGYSTWLFFTITFIANFNASFLCQTEKVGEQKICPRGISSSGRELDSHSRGTAIEARILQLVIVYNYLHCQFQRKFVVPNRKGWRIEKMPKGDQLKWQSARFAFERHRDRYPDSPISFSLQLFSLPIATQVFCAKQKRLENRKYVQGDQLKWQSARFAFQRHRDRDTDNPIGYSLQLFSLPISTQVCCAKQKRLKNSINVQGGLAPVVERWIRIREAPGSIPGFSNQFFFTIIFVANCNTSFLCQTEKVGEQTICPRGISSSGRALDSNSRGTAIETRILQLVILYNYFHCQFQCKFVVPNRKG